MFKNYLKIAWRNLFRNKGFSFTNILGLTIGLTCTVLILLWVQDEINYNKSVANYDHISQVIANRDFNNRVFTDRNMVLPLAQAIKKEIPEVKYAVVSTQSQSHILKVGDKRIKQKGFTVSDQFFDMFTPTFLKGNAATAIQDAYSLVLTKATAKALFGDIDPLNKVVRVDDDYDAKVTAVVADVPGNASLQYDYINTFNYDNEQVKRSMTQWVNSSWMVYVQSLPGVNQDLLGKKINALKHRHDPTDKKISTYFTFPMSKWRLYSDFKDGKNVGGMIEYVRLFSIIAVIILIIACVNFMNLSTARSEKRAKEVGIRKTLGSEKRQLVLQFFFEAIILTCIAFVLSMVVIFFMLPSFNTLIGKQLTLPFSQSGFWLGALVIVLLTGITAGSYPALFLSSFNPVTVLKGTFLPGKKAVLPRRILVVAQFIISILLISATIIVYQQMQYIKGRDIGYNPDNLIMIDASPDVNKNFAVIKQDLQKTGLITATTRTLSPITDIWWRSGGPDYDGKPADQSIIFAGEATDIDFAKAMGIKLLQGKDFVGMPSDTSGILLNKAAVEAMNLKNPLGMQMRYGRKAYTVIGVTENLIMGSPFEPVDPMMTFFDPGQSNIVSIRLNQSAQLQKAIASIESIFRKYNPSVPFEYRFADEEFSKKFITEDLISKLTNIFAGLAIFICCIGLAGLASFTLEKRIREIGIRKVLGATIQQLLMLISKEFLKLILIAFVIAVPVTWWLMYNWLEKYAYRISISGWLFGIVGALVLLLTFIVVGVNTLKAAMTNPVKTLRSE